MPSEDGAKLKTKPESSLTLHITYVPTRAPLPQTLAAISGFIMKVQCLLLEMPIHHEKKVAQIFQLLKPKYLKIKRKENGINPPYIF